MALLEKRRYLNNHTEDFPQVILIVPSHVPNKYNKCGFHKKLVLELIDEMEIRGEVHRISEAKFLKFFVTSSCFYTIVSWNRAIILDFLIAAITDI